MSYPRTGDLQRIPFYQSAQWDRAVDAGMDVYSPHACCVCGQEVGKAAHWLRTARTNDGEWWLIGGHVDLTGGEWEHFQTQRDGSRAPTWLPIGSLCLSRHQEYLFAAVAPCPACGARRQVIENVSQATCGGARCNAEVAQHLLKAAARSRRRGR